MKNNSLNVAIKIIIIMVLLILIQKKVKENFESEPSKLTIVTAYFKINRTRNIDYTNGRKNMPKDSDGIYKEWMKGLLSYNGPMIIYTDENTYDYISTLRKNYPYTKIFKIKIEDLEYYKYFKDYKLNSKNYATMIWKEGNDEDINKKLYTLWNSKISLLKKSIQLNPFNTHYFAWFDIGYIRDKNKKLESNWPDMKKLKILDDKVLFNIVYGGPDCKDKGSASGGFIGCNKNNIDELNSVFHKEFLNFYENNNFVGNDQEVYQKIRCNHQNLIRGLKGLKSDYWENVPHNEWFFPIPYFYDKIFKVIEKFGSFKEHFYFNRVDGMDKVSVIIPTYNRFKYLLNTIKSIKEQTYKNIEIIVVNDKSTQKEYYNYDWDSNHIKIIHLEKNSKDKFGFACPGGYQRNFGIEKSTGKYIAFCDDDDIWFPKKIELQINAMKKSGCKMSSTDGLIGNGVYNKNKKYKKYNAEHYYNFLQKKYSDKGNNSLINGFPKIWTHDFLKINNCMICSSVILDKEIIDKVGKFIIARTSEDYDYWLRALEHTDSIYLKDICFYYDSGHGNGQNY